MEKDVLYLVDLNGVELAETANSPTTSWIHALPIGTYQHPVFGKLSIGAQKVKQFADNIKAKIRGIDPSINYMHGVDGGDGEAAGWVKDAQDRPDGLWLFVEWVQEAADKIKAKKFRYFSAEYQDKWTDSQGKTHENVFFGGALTNRPYMKNLLPINLSEATVESMMEFTEILTKGKEQLVKDTPKEGEDMDLKKLTEALGLPSETTESELLAKLAELGKGSGGNNKPGSKVTPEVPVVNLSEDLRKLSDENPLVKALIETVDAQNKALTDFKVSLREQDVNRRLAEFDKSKIVLTAKAKDMVYDFAMEVPVELSDKFWEILETMRNSSSLMVELGERAGTAVRYGRSKSATDQFLDEANKIAQESGGKISLSDAMETVAKANPKLYSDYRSATYSFQE
jgi:Mu-like prophage I protein.